MFVEEADVSQRTIAILTLATMSLVSLDLAPAAQSKLPTIADLDKAIVAENYAGARQIADVLLQTGGAAEQATVSLSYGHILLSQNDRKAFTEYRKNVRQLKLKGPDATLIEVYDAWALALTRAAETDAAVKTLEDILGKNENCDATAEAADVLAQLYLARGDTADAKRVVEAGLKQFTGYQPRKTGYIDQILKNRLKAKASPAQALYDAAEKLRHEKKFLEAGRVYTQVQTTYPKEALAQAAEFHVGECLVGLQRPAQALELWRKFLKESPGGAWRGQARAAVADLLLDQLDLAGATDQIRQAAAVLDNLGSRSVAAQPNANVSKEFFEEDDRDPRAPTPPVVGEAAGKPANSDQAGAEAIVPDSIQKDLYQLTCKFLQRVYPDIDKEWMQKECGAVLLKDRYHLLRLDTPNCPIVRLRVKATVQMDLNFPWCDVVEMGANRVLPGVTPEKLDKPLTLKEAEVRARAVLGRLVGDPKSESQFKVTRSGQAQGDYDYFDFVEFAQFSARYPLTRVRIHLRRSNGFIQRCEWRPLRLRPTVPYEKVAEMAKAAGRTGDRGRRHPAANALQRRDRNTCLGLRNAS